jgi:hypothetical protein
MTRRLGWVAAAIWTSAICFGVAIACAAALRTPAEVGASGVAPVVTRAADPSHASQGPEPGSPPTATPDARFVLRPQQADDLRVLMEFLHAYNAGQLDAALALLDNTIVTSDCDYEQVGAVAASGKRDAARWLQERIADHDHLEVATILNGNPGEELVVGVAYANRSSDTLRRLRFGQGIVPKTATKVVFRANPTRIVAFANGPVGGDSDLCRPEA